MDYLSQILADPRQTRKVTIETKPEKREAPPEAPLSAQSANLPQTVLDLLMAQQAQKQPLPTGFLEALLSGVGGGSSTPPAVDPMMGQIPMQSAFNPYGG